MSVDLTALAAPKVPSNGSSTGFITFIILVIAGFALYQYFSYRNKKEKE